MCYFLMSQGSFNPKIRFLVEKVCPVACLHTDRQTDGQTEWLLWAPFQGFRIFSFNLSSRIGPITSHHISNFNIRNVGCYLNGGQGACPLKLKHFLNLKLSIYTPVCRRKKTTQTFLISIFKTYLEKNLSGTYVKFTVLVCLALFFTNLFRRLIEIHGFI